MGKIFEKFKKFRIAFGKPFLNQYKMLAGPPSVLLSFDEVDCFKEIHTSDTDQSGDRGFCPVLFPFFVSSFPLVESSGAGQKLPPAIHTMVFL